MSMVKPPYYLSAYSLAVKAGFKGTLEQWLASLQGRSVELRYQDRLVQWRYATEEGEPEDEWKVLFSSDEVSDQMVQETLDQAQGYADDAAASAKNAAAHAEAASDRAQDAYDDSMASKEYAEQAASYADQARQSAEDANVPEALPNPQKLILIGAVEAEYDGSGEVKVEIPVGGSKDVHIGSEPPTNGEPFWINHDEEPEGGGAASPEAIKQAFDEYMAEHPETDPTVPDWAKQPNKPSYTAAEVGALPAGTPIPEGVTDEQIQNAVDAYLTENPPEGGGIPIPSSAQVGQTIVVKAVDEDGKPTEWEAADFPSGSAEWMKIATISVVPDDGVEKYIIDKDENGNTFSFNEIMIVGTSTDYGGKLSIWFNRQDMYAADAVALSNFFDFRNRAAVQISRLYDGVFGVLSYGLGKPADVAYLKPYFTDLKKTKIESVVLSRPSAASKGTITVYGR